jgi:predicted DNA-binding WGR domain protein
MRNAEDVTSSASDPSSTDAPTFFHPRADRFPKAHFAGLGELLGHRARMSARRFELDDDTSRKFWEIATEGKANTVRFGRIGTEGQVKTKTHPSEKSARVDAEKLVREKVAKGYVEVSSARKQASTSKASLVERLEAALGVHRRGYVERNMRTPPSGKALDAFRATVGRSLVDTSFYSLYSWRDGSKGDDFCGDLQLLPLASIVETKKLMDELGKTSAAPGQWWNDGWIPFLDDHSYDVVAIDTVGCFGGRPGQIIQFAKDDDTRQILHRSFDAWLETFVTALEKGLYKESKDAFVADDAALARIREKVDPGYPKDAFWEVPQAPVPTAGGTFAVTGTIPAKEPTAILSLPTGVVVRQAVSPTLSFVDLETHERTLIEKEGEIGRPLARLQDGVLYYVVEPEDPDSDCKPGAAVWFFDPRSGKKRRMTELNSYTGGVGSLDASADGKFAIAAAWDWIGCFDTTAWDVRHSVEGEYIESAIAPDGLTFATCVYKSNTIVVHRSDTGKTLRTLEGAADIGMALRFDPSGKYLVAFGGTARAIGRWTLADGELLRLPFTGGQGSSIAFSPDGRMLVVGTTGGSVRVFDLESGKVLWDAVLLKQGDVTSVTFAATGHEIYAVTVDRVGSRPSVIHRITFAAS